MGETERQTDRYIHIRTYKPTYEQTKTHTDRQTYIRTDMRANNQTNTHARTQALSLSLYTHTHLFSYVCLFTTATRNTSEVPRDYRRKHAGMKCQAAGHGECEEPWQQLKACLVSCNSKIRNVEHSHSPEEVAVVVGISLRYRSERADQHVCPNTDGVGIA